MTESHDFRSIEKSWRPRRCSSTDTSDEYDEVRRKRKKKRKHLPATRARTRERDNPASSYARDSVWATTEDDLRGSGTTIRSNFDRKRRHWCYPFSLTGSLWCAPPFTVYRCRSSWLWMIVPFFYEWYLNSVSFILFFDLWNLILIDLETYIFLRLDCSKNLKLASSKSKDAILC